MDGYDKDWGNLKSTLRRLVLWAIVLSGIGVVIVFLLDVAGAGRIPKTLVVLLLAGAILLKVLQRFWGEWPPTVEAIEEKMAKRRPLFDGGADSSGDVDALRGHDSTNGTYRCEDCGVVLERPGSMSCHNGVYSCGSCGHPLDDQIFASLLVTRWNESDR